MERPGAVQVAMIGDGERVHAERLHPVQQFRDPVGAVEEGVLAMRVEMHERHGYAAESAVFCAVMQWLILALTLLVMAGLQRLSLRPLPAARAAPLRRCLLVVPRKCGETRPFRRRTAQASAPT